MQSPAFASSLFKTITILACGAFVALHTFAADTDEHAKEKPVKPKTASATCIYYTYPGNEIKPQPEVATIITETGLHLSFSGIDTKQSRRSGNIGKLTLNAWTFVDIEPGTYEVTATFVTQNKRSKDPIVWTHEFKAGTIYYASFKTSFTAVFNNIQIGKAKWTCNITDNIVDEVKEKVVAARNKDIEDKKNIVTLAQIQAGHWGERITAVPVPQGLGMADVTACVLDAMKARKWEIVSTTEDSAIGQYPSNGWMYYLCVKYTGASVEIHGPGVSKNWSEGYKAVLTKQLNAKANPTAKK